MTELKDVVEVKLDFRDIIISTVEIALSLGYEDGKIPEYFHELVDEILSQVPRRCKIKAGYRILDLKKPSDRNDGIFVDEIFFKMDRIVTSQLRKADKAALFVCSIGTGMETWAKQMLRTGEPAMSYFIDTIASVTTENVTDLLHERIGLKMSEHGLKITNRYSPGYCNWSVAEQHLLFSLLPQNFCGITLTESALMLPMKSVSGVIGIGESVEWKEYICDRCGMKDCTHSAKRRQSYNASKIK